MVESIPEIANFDLFLGRAYYRVCYHHHTEEAAGLFGNHGRAACLTALAGGLKAHLDEHFGLSVAVVQSRRCGTFAAALVNEVYAGQEEDNFVLARRTGRATCSTTRQAGRSFICVPSAFWSAWDRLF